MQSEYVGWGTTTKLSKILTTLDPTSIFLVTANKSYDSYHKLFIAPFIKNYPHFRFSAFDTNPKIEDIHKGLTLLKRTKCNLIIAVGGGSVIDMAKSIRALFGQRGRLEDYLFGRNKIKKPQIKLIAIPTTSGTGSETTHFAVVYIKKIKYSLDSPYVRPDVCIVDPQLTMNLPPAITAATGMDALGQAIESYWSVNSTPTSKRYSNRAIRLIITHLARAVLKPTKRSRIAMSTASHLAGKAINTAYTTACHAVSYPLTSYFGIPHGHAVALTLGAMLVYNSHVTSKDVVDGRGAIYVKNTIRSLLKIFSSKTPEEAATKITKLMDTVKLKRHLGKLGVRKTDLPIILSSGFNPARMKNNPRRLTYNDLQELLLSLF